MATKTPEEIQALKDGWVKDPVWDIEDSEGFEDYREQLLAFRKSVEKAAEAKRQERIKQRADLIKQETNISEPSAARYLFLPGEIENELSRCERSSGELQRGEAEIVAAQICAVRATLLLAAQVKRVADALEDHGSSETQERMVGLYKIP